MHRRIPQLDGVRGVAVALVVIAHMAAGVTPDRRPFWAGLGWDGGGGGLIGVQIFFVLSGFLITSLLLGEMGEAGQVSFRGFYARRARRLVPALLLVCAVYAVYLLVLGDDLGGGFGSIFYAATYTTNLSSIINLPTNGWLGHTWSLAVEEQFYLAWPPLLVFVMRRRPKALATVAIAVIVVTVALRHGAPVLGDKAGAVQYEGLRWDALMVGCLLAIHPLRLPRWSIPVGAAAVLAFAIWLPNEPLPAWTYDLSTIAAAAFVIHAFDVRWLRHPLLRHLGMISYSLYLWHVLILRLSLPGPVSLVASIAAAEVSYYGLERRFLRARRPLSPSLEEMRTSTPPTSTP